MTSFLQQLENNEAVMLVYLAGELPIDDRLEFENMLAGDAKLQEGLAQLRAAHDTVMVGLGEADKITPLPVSADVAIRRVSRLLKQRQVEKLVRQAPPTAKKRRTIPRWAYWTGSVAAAMVGIVVWWGLKTDSTPLAEDNQLDEQYDLLDKSHSVAAVDDTTQISTAERELSLLTSTNDSGTREQPQ